MSIDLRSDLKTVRDYITKRIESFDIDTNESPMDGSDSIHQILLGYEFEQTGWLCLVFDTRSDASLDGEWTQVIEETKIDFPHWGDSFWNADDEPFELILPDGTVKQSEEIELEDFSDTLGVALKTLLLDLIRDAAFDSLPLSSKCSYAIEDFNGYYGWTDIDGD